MSTKTMTAPVEVDDCSTKQVFVGGKYDGKILATNLSGFGMQRGEDPGTWAIRIPYGVGFISETRICSGLWAELYDGEIPLARPHTDSIYVNDTGGRWVCVNPVLATPKPVDVTTEWKIDCALQQTFRGGPFDGRTYHEDLSKKHMPLGAPAGAWCLEIGNGFDFPAAMIWGNATVTMLAHSTASRPHRSARYVNRGEGTWEYLG
jgi:hypothetical protein